MHILITGGAGFIGCNLAAHFIRAGHTVTLFDNLSRRGSSANVAWLRGQFGETFALVRGDVRDAAAIEQAARGKEVILHLAAQVAVTTSVTQPREDFEINALGTFNALEAARASGLNPAFFYTSTNKVYGGMESEGVIETETRYAFEHLTGGVPETFPLDFHSPYGCSKGTGDQYVRDYHRIYGLPTVVFRQSCIYGLRQFGVEDQGWLAYFAICAALERPITIYGDGKQVRDVLFIDDLVGAFELALAHLDRTAGQIYNIGGGPQSQLSVWRETGPLLTQLAGRPLEVRTGDWRPGDQRIYVSDISKAKFDFGWEPRVSPVEGLTRLWNWVQSNRALFEAKA
jgi:CDP-paratose 2-epimerase